MKLTFVRDFVLINHLEKKLRRKLTESEKAGETPVRYTTDDGIKVQEYVPHYTLSYFVTKIPKL